MLVVKVDGKVVEGTHRWIEVRADGVADFHPYRSLDVRIEMPNALADNALALRRIAEMMLVVADLADEKVKGPAVDEVVTPPTDP